MSRPYRITTAAPHPGTTITADDEVNTRIELPSILPPEQQAGVLTQVLKEHGFEKDGDGLSRKDGGVKIEIDPDSGSVRISAEESLDLPPSEDAGGGGCTCAARLRAAAQEAARDNSAQGLQGRVTGRLKGALGAIGCELEKVGNQVIGKSLVAKARTLGEIKRIDRDNETGGMTIVVEV